MNYTINQHQINKLAQIISKHYDTFATQNIEHGLIFSSYKGISNLNLFSQEKCIIPFKKIIFPNNYIINSSKKNNAKMAFLGLNICDVHALHILLKQFKDSDLLPPRDDIFVLATECTPDDNCFCHLVDANRIDGHDLYIQKESGDKFRLFVGTKAGQAIVDKLKIKSHKKPLSPRPILETSSDTQVDLSEIVDNRKGLADTWQKIANNCFGCGACTAVCPLCFCFHQEEISNIEGSSKTCLKWDSCFSSQFSQIQNNIDLRPKNVDRLYNWYHHKFVRGPKEIGRYLCTGCGRCITACPADLNIKYILASLDIKIANKLDEIK